MRVGNYIPVESIECGTTIVCKTIWKTFSGSFLICFPHMSVDYFDKNTEITFFNIDMG